MSAAKAARPRTKKLLAVAAGLVVLWAGVGFLLLPPLLRPVVERKLAEALHRPATLRRLALNPFALSATLEGLDVKGRDGRPFLSFERLYLNLEASSLFRGGPVVREVRLEKPAVSLARHEDGTYSVSDLLEAEPAAGAEGPGAAREEEPARFSVNNIRVEGGRVDFDDRPKGKLHAVRDVAIGIPFLSNIPSKVEITTQPVFEAKVNGAPFALRGETKPFSETRETTVDLDLADVDLPYYLAYLPAGLAPKVTSARLDSKTRIAFVQPPKAKPALVVSGTTSVRDLAVELDGQPVLSWERLDAVVDAVDVFGRTARVRSLKATRPEVRVRRDRAGGLNLATALPASPPPDPGTSKEPAARGAPFVVEIAEAGLVGGTVRFEDLALSRPFRAVLGDVAVTAKGLSTAPGTKASVEASATSDAGETVRHAGTLSIEPLAAEGEIAFAGIPLKRYGAYLDGVARVEVDDGVLDLRTRFRHAAGPEAGTALTDLSATLASPRFRRRGEKEPFFSAPAVAVTGVSVDAGRRALAIGDLSSAKGTLAVVREADGSVDLATLLVPSPPGAPPSPAWDVTAARLALDDYTVRIADRHGSRRSRFAITKGSLGLEGFSTARGARAALALGFGVDGTGRASLKGAVGLDPVFADLAVDVTGIDLVPLEPYVLPGLKLTLAHGTLSGAGRLTAGAGADGRVAAGYAGSVLVAGLRTIDPATALDFLRWETLSVEGLQVSSSPASLEAARLAVSDLACDLTIEADGTVNLRRVAGAVPPPAEGGAARSPAAEGGAPPLALELPEPAAAHAPAPAPRGEPASAGEAVPVRIGSVTLQGGSVGLTDRLVTPSYSATLTELGGSVNGLSSEAGTVAQLDLRGRLAGHSPIQLTGSINPLAASAFADVKATFSDVDLPAFTPYSGKYVGYAIARGKLTMEVRYKLQDRRLTAQNRFLVDRLELGEKIESKDATKLPVKLAVSLLKDENGLIDLDLPVQGSLDDPKFRIGKVVLQILGNLIAKAATAPFALLGKLFGGKGEELSTVDFADGRDALDETATRKLDALAKALLDRPALRLEATGRFSAEADLEGLRRLRFERKVKVRKLAALAKKGEAPGDVDDVVLGEDEYERWLKRAYRKETFPKPRNALGLARDLPASEMEKLMLTHIPVTPEDLRRLANARATAVKEYLVTAGGVDASRILVLEPGSDPAEPVEKARASRVDFSLK